MPGVLTNIATVYPDVQSQNMDDVTLKPLFFTIKFAGTLPKHLIEQNIPIEISVSIAEEYGCFAMPFVKAMSMSPAIDQWRCDITESESNVSKLCCFSNSIECVPSHDEILIPFFPLPSMFDHRNQSDWEKLSKEIEKWLMQLNTGLPQWMWGWDAFWLAFVAAFPFFPRGTWPLWNPRVPLEGAFIEQ
ncbi:hypothetical protein P692DRAFT_201731155 [Suillus brevipes Sb2]|nr:hypothetical protein P692DRAFT_201731155 [Suillus brevipes Sb2]